MSGFKVSAQPPNSVVATPHDVAEESYNYWTGPGGYGHVDSCIWLSMEDGETSFRWSWRLLSGSFTDCVVGDHGHAFGGFQHQLPRIRVIGQDPPKGCGINIMGTALSDPAKGAITHLQNLQAADFETTHVVGYRGIRARLIATQTPHDKVAFMVKHFEQSADHDNDIRKRLHEFDYWNAHFGRKQTSHSHSHRR
jgi:hypothetical protein